MKSVFICGSGRSGTSMLAGLFSAGDYFQGDDLYPPRDSNPRGFFENWKINSLNEHIILGSTAAQYGDEAAQLLASFYREGQFWLAGLPMDLRCHANPEQAVEIAALVARAPFCYKDPRFSYTLEPWFDAAPGAVALCVFRPPGVVVASILREIQAAGYLHDLRVSVADLYAGWRGMYLRMLLLRSRGRDVRFLCYEDLFQAAVLTDLEKLVGAKLNRKMPDRKLNRVGFDGELDKVTQEFFEALSGLAGKGLSAQTPKDCSAIIKRFAPELRRTHLLDDLRNTGTKGTERGGLTKKSAGQPIFSENASRALIVRLHEQTRELASASSQRDGELAALKGELESRANQVADLGNSLHQFAELGESLRGVVAQGEARIAALGVEQGKREAAINALQGEVEAQKDRIAALGVEQAQREAVVTALHGEVATQSARIEALDAKRAQQAEFLASLRGEISLLKARVVVLDSEITVQGGVIEGLRNDSETMAENLARCDVTIVELQNELQTQQARMDAFNATLQLRDQRIAVLNTEAAAQETRIASLYADLGQKDMFLAQGREESHLQKTQIAALHLALEARDARIAGVESDLAESRNLVDRMVRSKSWRITAPMRAAREWVLGLLKGRR